MPYYRRMNLNMFKIVIALLVGTMVQAHLMGTAKSCLSIHEADGRIPYYRFVPAYMGKAMPHDVLTHSLTGMAGRCYANIAIHTNFAYLNKEKTKMKVDIRFVFDPDSWMGWFCDENIQISTAFQDHYNFYYTSGDKRMTLEFNDIRDVIDIHKSGLRFFTYCANSVSMVSSMTMTSLLWMGGSGTSKYLPVFGSQPTNYQQEGNSQFFEDWAGWWLNERVIDYVPVD